MYKFETNFRLPDEIEDEIRPFSTHLPQETTIVHQYYVENNVVNNSVSINDKKFFYTDEIDVSKQDRAEKLLKRSCKGAVYKALSDYCSIKMPWGSLTGIRPTKLAYDYLQEGGNIIDIAEHMQKKYEIQPQKAKIVENIVLCQAEYLADPREFVNLYIHIPFCPTKCSYCSFITHVVDKYKKTIPHYVDCLVEEIAASLKMIKESGRRIYSVYIGGGTPTALPDDQFERVLAAVDGVNVEFTCEAGRPDTITREKAEIMKRHGVTRVCVNPQSLCNETLALIGRRHTAEDFFATYELIKSYGFDVNVDLIAGLSNESTDVFMRSLHDVVALSPQNITVHTLSVKNGSDLKNSGERVYNADTEKMVSSAYEFLSIKNYLPYYLYRQKNMLCNLENAGYSLPGKICVNNVTTMEETLSVVACGAGAISKRVYENNRIERLANVRDATLYIQQFDERLEKKLNFFTK